MANPQPHPKKEENFSPVVIAFVITLLYWTYHAFISQMIIVHDAYVYKELGQLLYQGSWIDYLRAGPTREPIYPFLVSLSMRLSASLPFSYENILIALQLGVLLATQILTLILLRMLKINYWLSAATILYLAFSPALLNTALSHWSEIAAYPFVLMIVIFTRLGWKTLSSPKPYAPTAAGFFLGLSCVFATFVKGIFEFITPLYLIPFLFFAFRSFRRKEKLIFRNVLFFLTGVILTYYGAIFQYKSLNKKYNGQFALTDRGAWALYGNTARRVEPLTQKKLMAAFLTAPGIEVCQRFVDEEACYYWWSYRASDDFGLGKMFELRDKNFTSEQIDKTLMRLSVKKVFENPFQFLLLWGAAGLKMLFWESTDIGFVVYPTWLTEWYKRPAFYFGLPFVMAGLTLLAILGSLHFVWRKRKLLTGAPAPDQVQAMTITAILILVFIYIALHSLFHILTRYALPIAPLYLVLIAFFFQRILKPLNNPGS